MRSSRVPSTRDLRAFETVVRLGSIKAAADHLCVTPSALSKRIQALEEDLGQQLFRRDARALCLTDLGRIFAARLSSIFTSLSEATELVRAGGEQSLRILVPSLFAYMLIRRLKGFELLYPNVNLTFDVFPGALGSDARIGDSDVVILQGDGKWQGWESVALTPGCYFMPLCSPDYISDAPLCDPAEFARYTWMQVSYFPENWRLWCNAVGHPGLQPRRYFEVNSAAMAREAALHGLGIYLGGDTPGVRSDSAYIEGKLVLAHSFHAFCGDWGYYLAYRPESLANPLVPAFKEWLLSGFSSTGRPSQAMQNVS